MNLKPICTACGTQYLNPDDWIQCPICLDDRQYIPEQGQTWTNLVELSIKHKVATKKITESIYELKTVPGFAIGQRALLILSPGGNILWDCIALLDDATIEFIKSKGELKAIAFSHPHYYSTMNDWAKIFDCPIYIHEKDAEWIYYKTEYLKLWSGDEHELWDGITIYNVGGHFPGSCVLRLPDSNGTLLTGDTFYLSPHLKHLAIMYSYPNRIPLPLNEIHRIKEFMEPIEFDSMFGFYDYQNIYSGAKELLNVSLGRYL